MVVPRIWVPIPKTRVNCPNVKNNLFLHFLVSLCKKISSGWQSDNFDPRRSAYGSSESLCPIFFKTPAKKVIIFKIVGASPLQSQVIQICVPQNRCFLGTFLGPRGPLIDPSIPVPSRPVRPVPSNKTFSRLKNRL